MADDIRTMKSYMTGLTMGMQVRRLHQLMIHLQLFQLMIIPYSILSPRIFRLAGSLNPNTGEWIFDQLVMTAGATDGDVKAVLVFVPWNEQE